MTTRNYKFELLQP